MTRPILARLTLVAACLTLAAGATQAQTIRYPRVLAPLQSFTVPAGTDTVFVISRAQMEAATVKAESLVLADSTITVLERKAALLGEIIGEQQGIIDVRTEAYTHYRDLWAETDRDLEEAEVKVDKYRRSRLRWALVSAAVVGLTGFLIGSAVN